MHGEKIKTLQRPVGFVEKNIHDGNSLHVSVISWNCSESITKHDEGYCLGACMKNISF